MSERSVAVVTGAASGMGAATAAELRSRNHRVIGIDLTGSDVDADLGTPDGRSDALRAVEEHAVDAVATFAGVSGFGNRPGSLVVSVNYFGTVELLDGLRPRLAEGGGAALAVSSNTITTVRGINGQLVDSCLAGDEVTARAIADDVGAAGAYAAAKLAVARWVRRQATTAKWAGAGVSLNAVAPGYVETGMTAEMLAEPEARRVIERTPLPIGRPAQPEEIAALAGFLLGPEGRFCVGSVIFMDGGTDALARADDWPSPRAR